MEINKEKAKSKMVRKYFSFQLGLMPFLRKWSHISKLKQAFNAEVIIRSLRKSIGFLTASFPARKNISLSIYTNKQSNRHWLKILLQKQTISIRSKWRERESRAREREEWR